VQSNPGKETVAPGSALGPVRFDVGVGNVAAGASGNKSDASVGAQANLSDGAVTVGGTKRSLRGGLSLGVGAAARAHYGDADNNGVREIGGGLDLLVIELDFRTEALGHVSNFFSGGPGVDRSVWTSVDTFANDGAAGPARGGYTYTKSNELVLPALGN